MGPIAPVVSVLSGVLGIASSIKSYKDAKDAAKDQKEYARLNAASITDEGTEEGRRAARAEGVRSGESLARMGASGLAPSGSLQRWEQAQQDEFAQQMGWLDRSTGNRANMERKRGSMAAASTRASGQANLFQGLTGGAQSIATGGKNAGWWG